MSHPWGSAERRYPYSSSSSSRLSQQPTRAGQAARGGQKEVCLEFGKKKAAAAVAARDVACHIIRLTDNKMIQPCCRASAPPPAAAADADDDADALSLKSARAAAVTLPAAKINKAHCPGHSIDATKHWFMQQQWQQPLWSEYHIN